MLCDLAKRSKSQELELRFRVAAVNGNKDDNTIYMSKESGTRSK